MLLACIGLAVPTAVAPGSTLARLSSLADLSLLVAAVWVGVRAATGPARRAWCCLGLAVSCWLAGDLVQHLLQLPADQRSPADAFWLTSYPLLVAGVALMIRARGLAAGVLREVWLDVVAVTVAATVGSWQLLIAPEIARDENPFVTTVSVLFPVGAVAVFALAVALVLTPGVRSTPEALLIGCLGSRLLLDALYSGLPTYRPSFDIARLDALSLITNALLGAAALHPERSRPLDRPTVLAESHRMHRWRAMMLGLALSSVSVAAAMSSNLSANRFLLLSASLLISAIILVRFYGVIRGREHAEEELAHQATHDQLTGLANRGLLLEGLNAALLVPLGDPIRNFALYFIDLDGFKQINDTHGHPAGDEVLRAVAERLRQFVRAGDTVARLGGDEFVVLCLDVEPSAVPDLGRRVRDAIRLPLVVGSTTVQVGASIGALAAADLDRQGALDADQVLQSVDVAMYAAKRQGGGVQVCSAAA